MKTGSAYMWLMQQSQKFRGNGLSKLPLFATRPVRTSTSFVLFFRSKTDPSGTKDPGIYEMWEPVCDTYFFPGDVSTILFSSRNILYVNVYITERHSLYARPCLLISSRLKPSQEQTVLTALCFELLTGFDPTEFYLLFHFLTVVFCHDPCSPQLFSQETPWYE